jgi:solute:Na+ symporter, SSS family
MSEFLCLASEGEPVSRTPLYVLMVYMGLLLALGVLSSRFFRGTSKDYFVASQSIGSFMLLMSVFGTTMTGFALVGSSGKAFSQGIGTYGLMASWSGLIHSAVFFAIGIKLWSFGKKYGYVTQIQFFRDRFDSKQLGYLLFPILVLLIIPYLLVGLISVMKVVQPITSGMFPDTFALPDKVLPNGKIIAHPLSGGIPGWLSGLVVSSVVLFYVFLGGVRSAVWANTFQTVVFMVTGVIAFYMIADKLGGVASAAEIVKNHAPEKLIREGSIGDWHFFSYLLIPLSVGMFPHLFQHWLTAKNAKSFRLTVIAHPICIAIVWVPCILIGIWAAGLYAAGDLRIPPLPGGAPNANAALATMVRTLVENPLLSGLLMSGILAAIMSSLDSQFVCLGTMFTNDIVVAAVGKNKYSDRQLILLSRCFIVVIVLVSYCMALSLQGSSVFSLGVWCFSGFAALFPLVFAAVYWKRASLGGAVGCILATLLSWCYFFYQDIFLDAGVGKSEYLVADVMPVTFVFLASLLGMIIGSMMTSPPSKETLKKFFPTLS